METNTSETMGTSVATFTVDPVAGGTQAQVTIETQSQSRDGLAGVIERFLGRLFLQRVYAQELARLAVCAEGKTRTGNMSTTPRPKGPRDENFWTRISAERRGFVFIRDNPR